MWPEGVSQRNEVQREESFYENTCQKNSLQSASLRSHVSSPTERHTTPAAARRHHPAVHYYPSLPFFPMTPLDFNHLLISPVVWGKAWRTEFKLPRSEDRSVAFSYEKEYGMCAVHPISQPRLVDKHSNIAPSEGSGVRVKVAANLFTLFFFFPHAAPFCLSKVMLF